MIEIDLDDRQIGFLVHANQLGIMSRRSRIFILQLYPNAIRLLDHVTIGDDVALGVNDYARTERSLTDGPGIRTALTWLASEELVEEILERRITAFVTAIPFFLVRIGMHGTSPAVRILNGRFSINVDDARLHLLGDLRKCIRKL